MTIAILAVIYNERSYQQTRDCLAKVSSSIPVYLIGREGVGSLAKAFNEGFARFDLKRFDYVWLITNITFFPDTPQKLAGVMAKHKWVGASPAFQSDHSHLRPNSIAFGVGNTTVPFIEFTAAMVHGPTFAEFLLDEKMPYVGHDLDWSYRVQKAGFYVGVIREVLIGHAYLRFLDAESDACTKERLRLRNAAAEPTTQALVNKYGDNWKALLYYNGAL